NAAKFGRNMTSTGIETARLSLAGNQATSGTMGAQQGVATQGAGAVGSLFNGAVNANSSAGNLLLGAAQAQNQQNSGMMSGLAGLGMAAGSLYTAFSSSKGLKEKVSDKPAKK